MPGLTGSVSTAAERRLECLHAHRRVNVFLQDLFRIDGVKVYHAGTRAEGGKIYTAGGRILNVTARGATLVEALERAYFVAQMIEFEGKDYRKDIGKKGLAKQK